ncbi:Hypothetical protein SRAE_1000075300 [Strongyloides ratti]|uniref:Uncharacterized protein n=1 Tax=Strongyloides ratti TaxID=34506 RepID=A0A090KY83_STRRB|nr:Hypothetical protein SRAE_1000075300 [Strongyloides ratti]CEF62480.1 Hypothetical protein SRAE_1000075300 [Strongyloides ratti]
METEDHHMNEEVPGPSDERKIQERLIMLQMKLEKARKHKELYIDYIKNKYPGFKMPKVYNEKNNEIDFYRNNSINDWKFKSNYNNYGSGNYYYTGTRLLEQLETSKYFWDINKYKITSNNNKRLKNLDNQIGFGGIILHSEMPMAVTRIKEVKADLVNLRNYRLNMGSEEYFRLRNDKESQNMDNSLEWNDDSLNKTTNELLELRKQIINLNLDIEDYREIDINQNIQNNTVGINNVFDDGDTKFDTKNIFINDEKNEEDNMINNKNKLSEEIVNSHINIKKDEEEDNIKISKNRTINFISNSQSNAINKSSSEQLKNNEKTDENTISSVDEKLKMLFGNKDKTTEIDDASYNKYSKEKDEDLKSATKTDFLDNLFNKNKKEIKDNKVNIVFKKSQNDESDDDFFN